MICGLTPPPCWPSSVEVLGAYAMRMVAVHILMKWLIEKKIIHNAKQILSTRYKFCITNPLLIIFACKISVVGCWL